MQLSLEDGDMRELSVLADPANKYLTKNKQKIRILDHPKTWSRFFAQGLWLDKE